jgi:hypothetical protein
MSLHNDCNSMMEAPRRVDATTMPDQVIPFRETVRVKGVPRLFNAVRVKEQTFVISGSIIRTAALRKEKEEWLEDLENPEEVVQILKKSPARIDLLRFWQRIPESKPKFKYYFEWRDIAAIPVSTYKRWFTKQISPKARNKIRKSEKYGVRIQESTITDQLVEGIMGIFNQSPVRRGKPFWHYGKDFSTVKQEMSLDASRSTFVVAYFQDELIGFIKLLLSDRYAMITLILDKTDHRNKAPMNGMVAKAVEICADRGIPYITYTVWRRGEHGQFQESNGFEKIRVPEYFVPINLVGRLALAVGLHKGFKEALPERVIIYLLELRRRWYVFKLEKAMASRSTGGAAVSPN